jgi:hypothetical protein
MFISKTEQCRHLELVPLFFDRESRVMKLLSERSSLIAFNSVHEELVLLQKRVKFVKQFSAFYGTKRFITVFSRTRHWSLLELHETNPHP